MHKAFTIRYAGGRTTAAITGMPPGGQPPPRPYVIPVFIPMSGCTHRCTFCNQTAITGHRPRVPSRDDVVRTIMTFLPFVQHRNRPVQIAFYGGNFLGLPESVAKELLAAAAGFVADGDAAGIRFSTRPDTITAQHLAAVRDFPVTTIELGLQSLDDRVLALARRGHDAACAIEAAGRVKAAGYELGLQMMTGLPGDTPAVSLHTAQKIVRLAPDFVRIYPTLVLVKSLLAEHYQRGWFMPANVRKTIDLVSRLFLVFASAGIPVARMGLQADTHLTTPGTIVAGPFHPGLGEAVYSRIFYGLAKAALKGHPVRQGPIAIRVHPRHLSRMIGAGRKNLHRLQALYPNHPLSIQRDPGIGPHHLEVDNPPSANAFSKLPS